MRGRHRLKKTIQSLFLEILLLLSINLTDAKNTLWKPGNENDKRIHVYRTLDHSENNTDGAFQNVEQIPIDKTLRTSKRIPVYTVMQNDKIIPIDGILKNDGKIPINGVSQNFERIPFKRKIFMNRMQRNRKKRTVRPNQTGEIIPSTKGRLENNRKTQNEVQNTRRILDSYPQTVMAVSPRIGRIGDPITANIILASQRGRYQPRYPNGLQTTKYYYNGDKQAHEWHAFWEELRDLIVETQYLQPHNDMQMTVKTCLIITHTYLSARRDLRKYLSYRYFYENNLEFEVGYLVAEIISKYQKMLENFNLVTDLFYNNQDKIYAPVTYMVYLYTSVLEIGITIGHLCNMLNELEDKYRYNNIPESSFDDYHAPKPKFDNSKNEKKNRDIELAMQKFERQMAKQKSQAKRERKKHLANLTQFGNIRNFRITTPSRKQKRYKRFPMIYGWSIENW